LPSAYDRLPLGALRVFEAVARHLSFSEAAESLHVTPAAVSQQIKTLEAYIQVPLFRRSGRKVEITEEGLELLPAVRAGLDKLESSMHQIKQYGRAGPLQISLLASFLQTWLLPRIRSFRRKCPEIELRFHTSRELVDFSRAAIHVAIRFGRGNYPNLHSEKLLDDWIVPVGSPELIKQHGLIERGTDLSKFPLLESDDMPWRVWQTTDEEIAWQSRAPTIDDSAGPLDDGHALFAKRLAATREQGGLALQLRVLFCLSAGLPAVAQSGAVSRVDSGRGPRFQRPR